ncbi:MAG TPA: GTPase HflX, partial [Candidatus Nitrosocosmicus sp.]|nr:GTPase HflX [Candidatus Nitrosocosmicus sp.]
INLPQQLKVVLVTYPESFAMEEAKGLIESMPDYKITKIFTQKYLNRAKYGLGAGKAEEIKQFISQSSEIEKVVVDEHLSAKQLFNLETLFNIPVIDRERLILDLFYSKATTNESKLQIQLAEVQYKIPRIRENAKLMGKSSERAGRGGMGEYIVDVQFRDLKRQMSFIKEKLYDAHLKRQEYRKQRLRKGMFIVSLVGYTSSGKTTLFNLLTRETKETSARLFTTLSTTTRSFYASQLSQESDKAQNILLVDTVGFISRLPHYMIEAFKSTLEESLEADLILFLIDSSEELNDIGTKYSSSWNVLKELEVNKSKLYILLSKADSVDLQKIREIMDYMEPSVEKMAVSSKTGYGISKLKDIIISKKAEKERNETSG